ncbi:MAG: SpaH/EbpB family LPXTG-anchored major pilin [Leucobacter sp.]
MIRRKLGRRTTALLGATALGITALVGTGTAAYAAPQSYGNINVDQEGSLTIHKYLHQGGSGSGHGGGYGGYSLDTFNLDGLGDISEGPESGAFNNPVEGVVFTIYPLLVDGAPVDLSDPAAWEELADLTPGAACTAPTGYTFGTPIVMDATDGEGMATEAGLTVGLYQVCETSAPANIVDRANPFILTIPMPHEGGWVYDVHAYPKNGEGVVVKTIEEQTDLGLGSIVEFPVTVPVPFMGNEWTGFAIRDTLDERLDPVTTTPTGVYVDGLPLDPDLFDIDIDGQQVTMSFTPNGIAWLNEQDVDGIANQQAGKEVTAVFAGQVVAVGNGEIVNEAQFWPNNPGFDPSVQPPVPSNEVKTNWGALELTKRAAGTVGTEGLLEGAVFEVYNVANPYADECVAEPVGDAIIVNGVTAFASSGAGVISIAGLFVSDSENIGVGENVRCYAVKEIAAPTGYVLPENPFTPVAVQIGQTTTADNIDIVNTQQDIPELPLTGAAGQITLVLGGLGAFAVVAGLVLLNRRRTQSAA